MKKNYIVDGMKCEGCANSVKRALLQLPDVSEAEVELLPRRAVLTIEKSIDVGELQAQLSKAGPYTIKEAVLST